MDSYYVKLTLKMLEFKYVRNLTQNFDKNLNGPFPSNMFLTMYLSLAS